VIMLPVLISLLALIVSTFSFFVASERFRLDLYNKRFEIYLRTVKYYQALMKSKDNDEETVAALESFIIASREAQFLFSPESGVYQLLWNLNKASGIITGLRTLPDGLSAEERLSFHQQRTDAMMLWTRSMEPLEALMAPYLNYHYATALSALIGRARAIWRVWSARVRAQSDRTRSG
jgi:hypothetical protein